MAAQNYRPFVFVSYSRKDSFWLDRLDAHLQELSRRGAIDLFVDKEMEAGEVWLRSIKSALYRADVAVLLVSNSFLSSEFISRIELPSIRLAARNRGAIIIPLFLEECDASEHNWILDHQSPTTMDKNLLALDEQTQDEIFDYVSNLIKIFAFSDNRLKRVLRRKVWNWRFSIPFATSAIALGTIAFFLGWRALQPSEMRSLA